MQKIHMICNAHLDPVWLWQWEEGAAEAISTFRVAADFCEQFDGFVFNHNEAILYQWIEAYEPELFSRIQTLAALGKWHIMGGWYLQPDCNMPYGEGMIRQIQQGRTYFYEKFGVTPTCAVNVDSFGHSRGLVQILQKTGYDAYLFCRPLREFLGNLIDEWGYDHFLWKGYDGSEVTGHRHFAIYNSKLGKGTDKLRRYINERGDAPKGLMLWGIGNHGGGPSRLDLTEINELVEKTTDRQIVHSTPEAFFEELRGQNPKLPVIDHDLNPWAVGCYTTQGEIKRRFRMLEQELFATEKMLAHLDALGLHPFPREKLQEAQQDLLFAQFHDILPGTVIPSAMEDSLRTMDHGLEILSREKTQAFFLLAHGQPKAAESEIPILAYNPHPYPIEGIFTCEFHMNEEFSRKRFLMVPVVYQNGSRLPCQLEQEACQMPMQWRRKVCFRGILQPMQMNRFDCKMETQELKAPYVIPYDTGIFYFHNEALDVAINTRTGLLDRYCVNGVSYLGENAFQPLVIDDDDHSIGTFVRSFSNVLGPFRLMDDISATRFCGVYGTLLKPVHIVEDGEVRTVVEACFEWGGSQICLCYCLPKRGSELEVRLTVHWNEKNKMLKLRIPCTLEQPRFMGQVMFGYDTLPDNGNEAVAQRWVGVTDGSEMLSIINDRIYGSSFCDGELRLSLLRAPRYGCLARDEDRYILYNRGYVPHTDQGVHTFHFWLNAGPREYRLQRLEREALGKHEKPYFLSFFPSGTGTAVRSACSIDSKTVVLTAFKKSDYSDRYLLRLYNPYEKAATATVRADFANASFALELSPFEVKTILVDAKTARWEITDLLENQFQPSEPKHTPQSSS